VLTNVSRASDGSRQLPAKHPEQIKMTRRVVLQSGAADREYFRDLWRYRELLYILAWRDISVRYRQTVIGVAWAALRPLVAALVFTVVLGRLSRLPSGGVAYPVLVLTGMLPWQLFSTALTESGRSLVTNSSLISKVYFPRLIIPGSSLVTSLVDFCISGVILALAMAYYGTAPTWRVVFLPLFTLLGLSTAAGVGIWVAALAVRYRDFLVVVPFLVQLGLYLSPVGFSSGVVPENWRLLYALNPMVGVIEGFRWCILARQQTLDWVALLTSSVLTGLMLLTGVRYFRRTERMFADVI
jgi:lipopolysaccharide transport system permease protein